jgi:hypothetical protein
MTDIVDPPLIDLLPAAPLPTDTEEEHDSKAYAMVSAQVDMIPQLNAANAATKQNATSAKESALAASGASTVATQQADAAMAYRNTAGQHALTATQSAATASGALADMQKLYLGAKASAPAADNQGNPLQAGAWYTQTAGAIGWYWWDGAAWQLGVGDIGSGFMSAIAGSFDGTAAMSGASVQSHNLYAAAAGVHGPDWPSLAGQAVVWMVGTFGDANNAVQTAQLASASGVRFERSKSGGVWGGWSRVITDTAFVEKLVSSAVVGGSGVSHTVNPASGSIHVITLTVGALTLNLAAPRQLGDQVTVRIVSSGGAWPITFGANVKLPVGVMPAYSAGQALTLVFVAMRAGFWDCYYSGVHA